MLRFPASFVFKSIYDSVTQLESITYFVCWFWQVLARELLIVCVLCHTRNIIM